MPPIEALLLLPLAGLALALVWLEKTRARRKLAARIAALRMTQPPTLASRIPWRTLTGLESRMALVGLSLVLIFAFMLNLSVWFTLALLAVFCPLAWITARRYRIAHFRQRFAERFPEAVDGLTRAVQAGVPVEKALASLGEIFEGVMAERFRKLVWQLELGFSFRDALRNFSADLNLPDVDYFCAVLALNRESGSPLSPMLVTLSKTLRERQAVDRRLRGLTAESRASARILSFLPLVIVGLQAFLNPAQFDFLLSDPTGRLILGYCAGSIVIGLLIIRRMSRLLETS